MANNERAEKIIENLNDQWHRLRQGYVALQGRTKTSIGEHEGFVASVLAGDAKKAETQMHEHPARVRDDLIQLVEKLIMPFSNRGFSPSWLNSIFLYSSTLARRPPIVENEN